MVLQQVLQEPAASQELTPRHAAPQGAAISLQQSGGLQQTTAPQQLPQSAILQQPGPSDEWTVVDDDSAAA